MITFVTAASSNHFRSAKQFLYSCPEECNIVFYDIGLTEEEAKDLQVRFPRMEYRVFDFSKYPDWMKLSSPHAGAYAWKPVIIYEAYVLCETNIMVWCDAGNIITDEPMLKHTIRQTGIYSPASAYDVETMTHIDCRNALRLPYQFWRKPMRNAAIVGFVTKDKMIEVFLETWKTASLEQDIIIPKTSSRKDHRWDQSILTCLMYNWDVQCPFEMIGVKVHQDCDE